MTLNLNWEDSPSAESILKLFLSLPAQLNLQELYQTEDAAQSEPLSYSLRSLIVFSQDHYYSYVLQKGYCQNDPLQSRWVLLNDAEVSSVPEGWAGILETCLQSKAYPTVLVYEANTVS